MSGNIKRFCLRFCSVPAVLAVIAGVVWFSLSSIVSPKGAGNVILISIDTCRADYLSCYGYERRTTPNIDALAEEGILFENTVSPVPITLPAHGSMLSGTIPPYHGTHDNLDYYFSKNNVTLAEILKAEGFSTAAFVSAFIMDSQFGLDQGFDTYHDQFEGVVHDINLEQRKAEETTRIAIEWLSEHASEKSFLFLHYYDPHIPYEPPAPFDSKFEGNPYAGEVAYTDYYIGRFIDKLKELKLYDSSLIIITGDHGEMLGEHGERSHMYFIYESAVKVPLIFKLPGRSRAKRIAQSVGLIDIVPTVCGLLGINSPADIQGKDLSAFFSGQGEKGAEERYLYCESLLPTQYGCSPLLGVTTGKWKYIQTTRPELYDLRTDPQESHNLFAKEPKRAELFKKHLELILKEQLRENTESKKALDEEAKRRLGSLGYLTTHNVSEDFEFEQDKDDPKDFVGLHAANASAEYLINHGLYDEAKTFCEEMLTEHPDYVRTYVHLGEIAKSENRIDDAIANFRKCIELDDKHSEAYISLGRLLVEQGRYDEAIEYWKADIALKPNNPKTLANLALTFLLQEKYDESIETYLEALRYVPDSAVYHRDIADVYIEQNDLGGAVEHLNESLRLNADQFSVHNKLADVSLRQNDHEKFMLHLAESLRLNPNQPTVHYNMGRALLQQDKLAESAEHFEKVLRLTPGDFDAHNMLAQVFHKQNNLTAAALHLSKSIKIRPDQPAMLNRLAWLKSVHKDAEFYDPQEAIRLARRCCELTKYGEPRFLDT